MANVNIYKYVQYYLQSVPRGTLRQECVALRLRSHRLQIGNDSFGIAALHAKLGHGKAKTMAVGPDAGRQQFDHVGIAGGWSAPNPRRVDRPIHVGPRRQVGDGSALQPPRPVEIPIAVARRVALSADGHVFDEILSASDVSRRASWFALTLRGTALRGTVLRDTVLRLIVLGQSDPVRDHGESDCRGDRKDSQMRSWEH